MRKIMSDKRKKRLMVTYISCGIVWAKTARAGVSRNLWFQAKMKGGQYYIVSPIQFHLWNRAYIAGTSHSYIIPNCSLKLQYQTWSNVKIWNICTPATLLNQNFISHLQGSKFSFSFLCYMRSIGWFELPFLSFVFEKLIWTFCLKCRYCTTQLALERCFIRVSLLVRWLGDPIYLRVTNLFFSKPLVSFSLIVFIPSYQAVFNGKPHITTVTFCSPDTKPNIQKAASHFFLGQHFIEILKYLLVN